MDIAGADEDTVVELLAGELPDLVAIYLFGSGADGSLRPDSDLDLAVLLPSPLAAQHRFDLQERLAAAVGRDVDLIDLGAASTVLRAQVIAKGRLLHESQCETRHAFEGRALADYARLNEERSEILQRIAREGRVLG